MKDSTTLTFHVLQYQFEDSYPKCENECTQWNIALILLYTVDIGNDSIRLPWKQVKIVPDGDDMSNR